jgi:hypothetical protein
MTDPEKTQPGAQPGPGDTSPHPRPNLEVSGSVGGDVAGRDLHKSATAGRDIVGRDVVTTTATSSTTTNVGFGIDAVLRLVVAVGMLVFVTALCFFSSGAVVGGAAIVALRRPVNSNNADAAARFAEKLPALRNLPPGTPARFSFTEEEISSYFRQVTAPSIGVRDGRVRLLDSGQIVVGGRADQLRGAEFAATFDWQATPGEPFKLRYALLHALPLGSGRFGWVFVPAPLVGGIETSINSLFGNIRVTEVVANPDGSWTVSVVGE